MEKKNPYITMVGFNKADLEHVQVAKLLNSMGRGKAQYIVKAVLAYQHLHENGQVSLMDGISVDYEILRRMVFQILDEREGMAERVINNVSSQKPEQVEEEDVLHGFDDEALNGIMASILAFQKQ